MTEQNNKTIPFLALDYNQQKESENLLKSLKKHVKLTKYVPKIVFLSNGGQQDYAYKFYQDGLIDDLILKSENVGCGFGTQDLFYYCARQDYAFYVQSDQLLINDITDELLDGFINALGDNTKISHIDVSGNQGHGRYSERAQFINVKFYNGIRKVGGGPGPFSHLKWTEESMQDHIRDNNMEFLVYNPLLFADVGKWSVREWQCGTETRHRADTKEMEFLKLPEKNLCQNLIDFYRLTEEEISVILKGDWGFRIPENMKKDSFTVQGWENI